MALYLLKPILWNTNKYVSPSGVRASPKSYPGMHGFGHEEWNNSQRMGFLDRLQRYRVFHTARVKTALVDEHAGQTFVLMIASHDGIQQLVGVAGNAMYLGAKRYKAERQRIANKLKIEDWWHDVWALPRVRGLYNNDADRLRHEFQQYAESVPSWICPADFFMWLEEPVTLNPQSISGCARLPQMFSSYQALEREASARVMNSVPKKQRSETWKRLLDAMYSAPTDPVPPLPGGDFDDASITKRLALTQVRVGQGKYRADLMVKWDRGCAVTGLTCSELLRASHVKPYSHCSSNREKEDPNNGLLLAAHLDALFDKGLITFDDRGNMLLSSRLPADECKHFGLPMALRRPPHDELKTYLAYHRKQIFVRT